MKCSCCGKKTKKQWGDYCSRSCRNIHWIESHLIVPDGKYVGSPVKVREWQRDAMKGIYDSPTRRVIISFGRKNGKTGLASMLLLLHLCGPEARKNSQLYSAAMSRDQAAILYSLAAKMVRFSPVLSAFVVARETIKELFCPELGTLYKALSADAATSYGLSPVFIVHDELGQVQGPRHPLYEALETATGAQEAPLSIVISTQAPNDNDLLSILIDDAKSGEDPETKLFLYAAPEDADPFTEETIRLANPAFGDFQSAKETMAMAEAARRMPAREAQFRNLILNQRVDSHSPFVTASVWNENADTPHISGLIYAGLDLSETSDLTAFVMVTVNNGVYNVKCKFWLPGDGIEEKSRSDRVPYDVWAKMGYIDLCPGRSIEYEYVAQYIAQAFSDHDVRKIAFDRYNMRHLKPWLSKSGLSDSMIEDRFQDFGQGFVSMSPAVRVLESILLNAKMRHGDNPVLKMCAVNSVVKMDEAGNRKLDKKKSRGRIDGMVALAMAVSVANEHSGNRKIYPVDINSILTEIGR